MLVSTESRIAPERFAEYVDELRHFSAAHHLPHGAPAHLPGLLQALETSPLFRAECTSMLRAVFYREHGAAPPEELLMLLIVSWGGEPSNDPSPALQTTITSLLRFAIGALRAPTAPSELPEVYYAETPLPEPTQPEAEGPTPVYPQPAPTQPRAPVRLAFAPREATPVAAVTPTVPATASPQLHAIDSELQILAIRSPDVKRYLYLLRQREQQLLPGPRPVPEPVAVALPPPEPAPPTIAQRENPWAPDSDFQIELRHFAAEREARMTAYEARHRQPPKKLGEVAEAAWQRLAGRKRP